MTWNFAILATLCGTLEPLTDTLSQRRASNPFLACVSPDPQLPLAERLAIGLEAHIQSFVDHRFDAVAINRGALSDDRAIEAIIAEELNVVGQRLTDQLVAEGRPRRRRDRRRGLVGVCSRSLREMDSGAEYLAGRPH